MAKEQNEFQAMDSDIDTSIEKSVEPVSNTPQSEFPEGGFRAWSVAAGAAGILFSTFGYANAFGVFQEHYMLHQLAHETPSSISWIGSLQIFFLFLGNVFGGPLFDQYGSKMIWPPALLYLLSVFMTSLCKDYYQFILAQGLLGGIAMGMTMAPCMAAVGQYFNKNRGAAMGLAIGGSSIGGVVFPIALSKMLTHPTLGFGWTIRILGFLMAALILPSCVAIRARLPPRKGKFFLPAAFQEKQYVVLILAVFPMILGMFMPFFYLPTFALSKGMSIQLSSYLPAILNGASFFGRVIPGVLGDKLGRLNALCLAGLSSGLLILCIQSLKNNAGIIVFSVVYGFCSGAIVSGMSVCMAQIPKDPTNIGTYMGMGFAVLAIPVLIGPPIDGVFVSHFGGYDQVAIFSGVVVLAGGFGVLGVKATTEQGIWGKV